MNSLIVLIVSLVISGFIIFVFAATLLFVLKSEKKATEEKNKRQSDIETRLKTIENKMDRIIDKIYN